METQAHLQMAHAEIQEERTKELVEEIQEEEFLKDLYLFMKKRDTPIERIPHLGFKQIDLFVMFKTVKDLGGYHQVTAQQLWKQVYNTLGGNPRSTSAATCTRRHYEKLLLPYECHMKGVLLNALPQHQPKHYHYPSYSKEDDDGQRPAKRKLLSMPLHQNPHNFPLDPHGSVFPLPLHHPHFFRPSHTVLPPFVPISSSVLTSHNPPSPQLRFPFHPSHPNPTERIKEPLEHLRYLAEQYKTSSGLSEPLNLSIKAPSRATNSNPTSSFTPPSSSKNPKFLNKPSPLYTARHPQVVRNEACETQDGEADLEVTPYPVKAVEGYVIDLESKSASSSPIYDSAPTLKTDEGTSAMAPKPSSPKTDFTIQPMEEPEGSPEVRRLNVSHTLPSPPRENGGKMEIEIPLSVFHNWLRLCGPTAMMHVAKQLHPPFQEEHSGQRHCSNTDIFPSNLTFHMNTPNRELSSAIEDLRLRSRNVPSPTLTTQTSGNHHNTSQHRFTSYKPLPFSNILKNAASQDVYPFDQQDIHKSYGSKPPNCWNAYDKESQAPTTQAKTDSSPLTVLQDLRVTKSYNEGTNQVGKEKSETGSSAVLMVNSSSLLHLTTEEVMKLKKIISNSS
ncbi:AT-rich interaction domain 6 [Thunnus albacares]|uniref:AT-rich interaction domain 6 n=1 Tax=Thunnus albacares TaxID=8236 RepID=UPI001CF677C9|nr:AT-rich interaction domain 6 [Thunnus albacares]